MEAYDLSMNINSRQMCSPGMCGRWKAPGQVRGSSRKQWRKSPLRELIDMRRESKFRTPTS